MKAEWLDFLNDNGAEVEDGQVVSYGNLERERRMVQTGLVICDLSHQGLISVDGEDASEFLQGQLTNDIRNVSEQHSQLSAYCTHKGRMLANFRVFKRGESFYLSLPMSQMEASLKRISMFVLMAKVIIKDSSLSLVKMGLSGPNAAQILGDLLPEIPAEVDDTTQCNELTIIKIAGPHPRYEIIGELDALKKIWQQLDVHAAPVGAGPWESLDIRAGIPTIYPLTSEAFVPQMTNMQVINGVSFKKGCYTGQEVVARMQYLGKLKRRMFRVHIDTDEPVNPADKLFAADSSTAQGTGQIVSAQPDPDGGHIALAVINIADTEKSQLKLHNETGPAVTLQDLPYQVEKEAS